MKIAKSATRARANRSSDRRRHAGALRLNIQNATRSRSVPDRRQFRTWVRAALKTDACVTIRLVGLREGRALNLKYRGRNYATNVLTFVLRDTAPLEADLALCAPVVFREARAQRKELAAHYAHLTVHAVLHLQGHQHDDDTEAAKMERLETRILKALGYPDPYVPTAHHG